MEGLGALGGGGFVEKKLMLSLVTTLPREKAPKEDMLFFSFCPTSLDHRLWLGL